MAYKLKKLEKSQVELTFALNSEEFALFKKKALEKIWKEMKIDWFRKWHVPSDIVSKNIEDSYLHSKAVDIAINNSLRDAIKNEWLDVLWSPKVDIKSNDPFKFVAIIDVLADIDLGDYSSVKLKLKSIKIDKKDIDAQIENFREKMAEKKEKIWSVKKWDIALVDFEGFDEKWDAVENTKSSNYEMEIWAWKMIPWFEKEAVWMSKWEEKDFDITFPKDYHVKQMAWRKYKFHILIKSISEKVLPKLNEDFVKKLYWTSNTIDFLKEDIEKYLRMNKMKQQRSELEEELLNKWSKKISFDVPQSEIDKKIEFMIDNIKMWILQQGMPWDHYLKHISKTEDDIKKELTWDAKENVRKSFIIQEIIRKEWFKVADKEVDDQISNIEMQSRQKNTEFKEGDYAKWSKNYVNIASNLLISKVFDKYLPKIV